MTERGLYWAALSVVVALIVLVGVRMWEAGVSRRSFVWTVPVYGAVAGVQQECLYDRAM